MANVIPYRFRLRRALAATWISHNDILLDGEIGWERDTNRFKVGDGVTPWNSLSYFGSSSVAIKSYVSVRSNTYRSVTATWSFPTGTTVPSITDGVGLPEYNISITPVSASSKLRIRLDLGAIGAQSGGTNISLRAGFFEGSTCVGFATQNFSTTSGGIGQMFLEKEVPNSSTATRSFTVRVGVGSGTIYINGNSGGQYANGIPESGISIMEI